MAKSENKAALLIALAGMKKKPGTSSSDEPSEESDTPDNDEIKKTAVDDVLAAVKSNDSDALSDALSRFVKACEGYE